MASVTRSNVTVCMNKVISGKVEVYCCDYRDFRINMHTGPGKKQKTDKTGNALPQMPRGSLTIEASLAVPIFMFAMFLVLSVINLLRFHLNLQEAVHQEAGKLAMTAYESWDCSEGSVRSAVLGRLDGKLMDKAPVKGGSGGIDFSGSRLGNREIIEINAAYEAQLPYDFFGLFDHRFAARCVMHTYIGYEKGLSERTAERKEEEYVYVAETGTVYHTDRECSYLRLSVRETDMNSLKNLRNSSGHKYYACKDCGHAAGNRVYITSDGTCYHSSLSCSGLKRTVTCVPLSEAGGMKVCSRCGHKH